MVRVFAQDVRKYILIGNGLGLKESYTPGSCK